MSLSARQWHFLLDVACLIDRISSHEFLTASGGELLRTMEQQKIHIKNRRSQTLDSKHLQKLAIDLNFFYKGEYIGDWTPEMQQELLMPIGLFWESLRQGNKWGGRWISFIDCPHFEAE